MHFIYADAHFCTGSAHSKDHSPCQDYAIADSELDLPFAIVSDGCSSSGRTDLGARVVALAARKILHTNPLENQAAHGFQSRLLIEVADLAKALELDENDLDATVGLVQARSNGEATALLFGDGVIAVRNGQEVSVTIVDWAGNLPGYPNYLLNWDRLDAFASQSVEYSFSEDRPPCRIRNYRLTTTNNLEHFSGSSFTTSLESEESRDVPAGLKGLYANIHQADVIAVMTDGVSQVSEIEFGNVVGELMQIKSSRQGMFVTRRLSRALNSWSKRGSYPVDDIAMAAIAAEAKA